VPPNFGHLQVMSCQDVCFGFPLRPGSTLLFPAGINPSESSPLGTVWFSGPLPPSAPTRTCNLGSPGLCTWTRTVFFSPAPVTRSIECVHTAPQLSLAFGFSRKTRCFLKFGYAYYDASFFPVRFCLPKQMQVNLAPRTDSGPCDGRRRIGGPQEGSLQSSGGS